MIDHHETGGVLTGVDFRDIRPNLGATSTIITGYLLERHVAVSPTLATALLYGIESEIAGYPREASSLDDGALVWLFPCADKDLLARIRNPKLPQSHFATFQHALANAFIYRDLVVSWCGVVTQPDIISELADFFVRFDQVNWALAIGHYDGMLKLSVRVSQLNGHAGEVLRNVVEGLGTAGGHDKRGRGRDSVARPGVRDHRRAPPHDPPSAFGRASHPRRARPPFARSQPRHSRSLTATRRPVDLVAFGSGALD